VAVARLGYVVAWTGPGDDGITIGEGFRDTIVIQLDGGDGSDTIRGGPSSEIMLAGPSGADVLLGSGGDDALISGPGGDVLSGSAGNDQMVVTTPCDGHVFSGDAGSGDIAGFALSFVGGVDATIGGTAVTRGVSPCVPTRIRGNSEVLEGTQYADVLRGNRRPNFLILGRSGPDLIYGRGGRDVLRGDEGADSLYGGGGPDVLQAHDSEKDAVLHCGRGGRRAVRDRTDPAPKRCGKHRHKKKHKRKKKGGKKR
jgi:Ca2+-binding RTX toxin-like protein